MHFLLDLLSRSSYSEFLSVDVKICGIPDLLADQDKHIILTLEYPCVATRIS